MKLNLSIIIPIYNVEKYIKDCLDSIVIQNYPNLEIIMIDDFSQDNSCEVIKGFFENCNISHQLIQLSENKGAGYCRNLGVQHALGEYIIFIDSDDYFLPYALHNMFRILKQHQNCDIVIGNFICEDILFRDSFTLRSEELPVYISEKEWLHFNFFNSIPVSPANKLINRLFFVHNKLWFPEGIVSEDVLWHFMVNKVISKVGVCFNSTYFYRANPSSVVQSKVKQLKRIESTFVVLQQMVENITPKMRNIESFNIFKLLLHIRQNMEVDIQYNSIFEKNILDFIKFVQSSNKISNFVKRSLFLLKISKKSVYKNKFLWNKILGIQFRYVKALDLKHL